jgi:hypothetical protein
MEKIEQSLAGGMDGGGDSVAAGGEQPGLDLDRDIGGRPYPDRILVERAPSRPGYPAGDALAARP